MYLLKPDAFFSGHRKSVKRIVMDKAFFHNIRVFVIAKQKKHQRNFGFPKQMLFFPPLRPLPPPQPPVTQVC
jgi:hypothetical protein